MARAVVSDLNVKVYRQLMTSDGDNKKKVSCFYSQLPSYVYLKSQIDMTFTVQQYYCCDDHLELPIYIKKSNFKGPFNDLI
jgi:hypothetical protein